MTLRAKSITGTGNAYPTFGMLWVDEQPSHR